MKLLFKGDALAVEITERVGLRPDAEYRLSHFVYPYEAGEKVLVMNTLTRQVYELDKTEWADLKSGRTAGEARELLARSCFLVEKGYDELQQYYLLLNTLRAVRKAPAGIGYYTILPTTACNARCVYCYEEGMLPVNMTAETADAVADFICRTKKEGKILIHWFGGEPLLGASVISRICRSLRDRGVEYSSNITTNGSLLTAEIAQEAKELWKLTKVQFSMDGARADYESRKRYIDPLRHNYDTALKAAELFADIDATVAIRCNYDAENLPRVTEFFNDCRERFKGRSNVKLYMAQLFQSVSEETSDRLFYAAKDVRTDFDDPDMLIDRHLETSVETRHCMADSYGSSIIIDPTGGLHNCELELNSAPLGTIFDEAPPAWPDHSDEAAEMCRDCCFLPDCTPFRKKHCPITPSSCKVQMSIIMEQDLMNLLKEKKAEDLPAEEQGETREGGGPDAADGANRLDVLC